ncbi:MAG: DNA polymerase ligase N-terminal domain-containing protein [Candidatus Moraniibacteriota bacterium]
MNLNDYKKKRDFSLTEEPEGGLQKSSENRFVIQKHYASHLHFDFRLEMKDEKTEEVVLKSWAIPKNIPLEKGVKHLAIRTEDHPVEYLNFEGRIPEGNYGAGEVEIWDKGKWGLMKGSFEEKMLKFNLFGEKVKGRYVMIRTQGYGNKKSDGNEYWLIWKKEA